MQRTIFLYGIVILAFGLFVVRMWLVNSPETEQPEPPPAYEKPIEVDAERMIEIRADQSGWMPVGRGPFRITADGKINIGGLETAPDDKQRPGDANALVPKFPYGRLVAKYGENGTPFSIGRRAQFPQQEVVYLAINDSDYSDNSGTYIVTIIGGTKY